MEQIPNFRDSAHTPEPSSISDKKTRILVNYMLFKPPKNDTNYYHFTEVESDWIQLKR